VVPGLAFERGNFSNLGKPRRRCLDEGEFTIFGEDEEKILIRKQEHLAVAVAAALPDALTVVEADAGEDPGVEAVGVTLMNDRVVEIRLEGQGGPTRIDRPAVGAPDGVDAAGTLRLGRGDENAAPGDESGLDNRESFPFVGPEGGPRRGIEAGCPMWREDEELCDTADCGKVR
jgi:hypothetical protein